MIDFFGRLDMFMRYRGLNDNKISLTAGISNGLIGKGRKRGGISQENISKLIHAYPELDANWLLTGQGSMLREQSAPEVAPPPSEPAFPGFIEEIKSLSVKVGRLEAENEHLRAAIEAKQKEIEAKQREIDNKEREIKRLRIDQLKKEEPDIHTQYLEPAHAPLPPRKPRRIRRTVKISAPRSPLYPLKTA